MEKTITNITNSMEMDSNLENILETLLNYGIRVELVIHPDDDQRERHPFGFRIGGFYKSGSVTLMPYDDDGTLYAIDRYNGKREIYDIRSLCALNVEWWERSKNRYDGWADPDINWIPLLIEYGFINEKVMEVKTYIRK